MIGVTEANGRWYFVADVSILDERINLTEVGRRTTFDSIATIYHLVRKINANCKILVGQAARLLESIPRKSA